MVADSFIDDDDDDDHSDNPLAEMGRLDRLFSSTVKIMTLRVKLGGYFHLSPFGYFRDERTYSR